MKRVGTRIQVMNGTAKQTGGGLRKRDLIYNKRGKIVSKKMSSIAKKRMQKGGEWKKIETLTKQNKYSENENMNNRGIGKSTTIFIEKDTENPSDKRVRKYYYNTNLPYKLEEEKYALQTMHTPSPNKHIVQFHHTEDPHDRNNLMLEYLEGETLDALETKYKSYMNDEIIENIKIKIQEIVNYIHEKDYAHRDFKVDNIMFREQVVDPSTYDWIDNIVFIDFGEAQYIRPFGNITAHKDIKDERDLTELNNYLDELKS